MPFWSLQPAGSPASPAELAASRAIVAVGPPFFWSESRCGSIGLAPVPIWSPLPAEFTVQSVSFPTSV